MPSTRHSKFKRNQALHRSLDEEQAYLDASGVFKGLDDILNRHLGITQVEALVGEVPSRTPGSLAEATRGSEPLRSEPLRSGSLPDSELVREQQANESFLRSGSMRSDSLRSEVLRSASLPLFTPTVNIPGVGKRRYYRCQTVQDAHTGGEDKLFNTMRRMARAGYGTMLEDGSWLLAASMDEVAREAGMHRTNVRNNLKGLIEKLAIALRKDRDPKSMAPRSYHGFSYRQILERRRAAGLEWVVKNRGITFVSSAEATEALRSESLRTLSIQEEESLRSETLPEHSSETRQSLRSVPLPSSLLGKSPLGILQETSTTIVAALRETFGRSDDDAAYRIAVACREATPDITDIELVFFIRQEGKRLLVMPGITNPLGLLIKHMPRAVSGESLRQHREAVAKAAAAQRQADVAMARDLLNDPESTEELRQWANNILERDGN